MVINKKSNEFIRFNIVLLKLMVFGIRIPVIKKEKQIK